jgi:hypothetical protein
MSSGGKKRTRSERVAALELPPGAWRQAWTNLRRRDVLVRIGLCVGTVLFLCALIRGWAPPFGYRTGHTLPRDLVGRVSFSLDDPEQTHLKRERARWQVRCVYTQDPELLTRLRERLRNTVSEVMAADSFDKLDREVWAGFQPPDDSSPLSELILKERFERFRAPLAGDEKLENFDRGVAAALAPFDRQGLLEALEQKADEGSLDEIVVYPVGEPEKRRTVKVIDVLIGNGAPIRESLKKQLGAADVADPVFHWLRRQHLGTLSLDRNETTKAQIEAEAAVPPVRVNYEPGQTLAKAGQPLSSEQIAKLRVEHELANSQRSWSQRVVRFAAVTGLMLGLFACCALYLYYRERWLVVDLNPLGVLLAVSVITVAVSRWAAVDSARAEIIPLLIFAQIVAIAYRRELALLLAGVVALILVLALGQSLPEFLILWGVAAAVVLQLGRVRTRSKLIYVGLFASLAAFALTLGAGILEDQPLGGVLFKEALRGVLWTLAAGFLMTGLLPFVERLFGVLTDISLLELGDVSHPLLQELVRRAASTYNHSITVGSIAEAAADAIGARGLLVRVGAYFHDIGKMLKPAYFIENQRTDDNLHESLVPRMSTLVIVAHIKDGSDLARQHKLPQPIIDLIEQHHGTTLVEYFFGRASEQSQADPNSAQVEEASFRYPGPKPQTKEAGVLMLADAAESACRSLIEPGSARIESLVREVAERKLQDGQFDESGLSLRELRTIEDSMIKSLIANYHGRVKYPDQRTT